MNYPFSDRWYWQDGPDNDVVISSRVRLLRNVEDFPFPHRMNESQNRKLAQIISKVFDGKELSGRFNRFILNTLPLEERMVLLEDSLLHQHLSQGDELYLNEQLSCLVNSTEHLRISCFKSGFSLQNCFEEVIGLESELDKALPFSANMEFGYLTSSIEDAGTGLKASVMLHLRGLAETGRLESVFKRIGQLSVSIKGYFTDKAQALGDFYQISNIHTLGIDEESILHIMGLITAELVRDERAARVEILKTRRDELKDRVFASYEKLKRATDLGSQEAISLLSDLRFGVELGLVEDIGLSRITSLYFLCQKYHVLVAGGHDREENSSRAQLVNRIIAN